METAKNRKQENVLPPQNAESVFVQKETVKTLEMSGAKSVEAAEGNVIKSPLVGTFYRSSSPDNPPLVQVGDTVKRGQVLGIVEAMKLMNEIESEFDGIVKEIRAENEQMVEYGQPLFIIV